MFGARGFRLLQKSVCCRNFANHSSHLSVKNSPPMLNKFYPVLLAVPVVKVACSEPVNERLQAPDPSTLTHSFLIRNACQSSIDSASALFHQTVAALMDAEQEYAKAVYTLVSLLSHHLEALRQSEEEQNRIWDLIILQKQLVKEKRDEKQELEMLYQSVEAVMDELGRAAFLAGSDVNGIRTAEHISSAQSHLRRTRVSSLEADNALTAMDVKVIRATAEQEKREEGRDEDKPAGRAIPELDLQTEGE